MIRKAATMQGNQRSRTLPSVRARKEVRTRKRDPAQAAILHPFTQGRRGRRKRLSTQDIHSARAVISLGMSELAVRRYFSSMTYSPR
jgi:hypothetical protein